MTRLIRFVAARPILAPLAFALVTILVAACNNGNGSGY
jgi:predicted small secreted protein